MGMNMIEKVAIKIYIATEWPNDENMAEIGWQNINIRNRFIKIAKVALKTLNEPTIEMISAGMDVEIDYFKAGSNIGERGRQIEASYKAMIFEALKE